MRTIVCITVTMKPPNFQERCSINRQMATLLKYYKQQHENDQDHMKQEMKKENERKRRKKNNEYWRIEMVISN